MNVYNSTKRAGLAGTTARELSRIGFRINKVENDPLGVSLRGVGEIRFGPKEWTTRACCCSTSPMR